MGAPIMTKVAMQTFMHGMCFFDCVLCGRLSLIAFVSIRLPHSEMALGFNGGYAGAQVSRKFSTYRFHSDEGQHSYSSQKMRAT